MSRTPFLDVYIEKRAALRTKRAFDMPWEDDSSGAAVPLGAGAALGAGGLAAGAGAMKMQRGLFDNAMDAMANQTQWMEGRGDYSDAAKRLQTLSTMINDAQGGENASEWAREFNDLSERMPHKLKAVNALHDEGQALMDRADRLGNRRNILGALGGLGLAGGLGLGMYGLSQLGDD